MLVIIILFLGIFFSCYYDNPPEPLPIDPEQVSFKTHILPILENSCSTSNCHDGTREPNLLNEVAYKNLTAGGYVNLLFPKESSLYKAVDFQENAMPPGGPQLPALDIELILIWIQKGAPND